MGEARHLQTVGTGESYCIEHVSIQWYGHFQENLENGLKFYSLNFNGILHVFDRT